MAPANTPSAVILNVGHDASLVSTRALLLRSGGHIVESTCSVEDAIARIRGGDFDLVILCHSLREEERQRLIRVIRSDGSSVAVMFVTGSAGEPGGTADRTVLSDPAGLLREVREVLQTEQAGRDQE
jgi:CheY-like chemotaxis protein